MRLPRLSDPGHFALRAAARTAVVVPVAFAIGQVAVGNPNTALFATFSALALLLFADFSGSWLGQQGEGAPRPAAARDLRGDIEAVRVWYAALGAALAARAAPPAPAVAEDEVPSGVLDGVREAAITGDRARTAAAVAVGWGSEHLDLLHRGEDQIAGAAARLSLSGQQPGPPSNPVGSRPPSLRAGWRSRHGTTS